MKKIMRAKIVLPLSIKALLFGWFLAGCNDADNGDDDLSPEKEDISVNWPDGGFKALVNQPFRIEVKRFRMRAFSI